MPAGGPRADTRRIISTWLRHSCSNEVVTPVCISAAVCLNMITCPQNRGGEREGGAGGDVGGYWKPRPCALWSEERMEDYYQHFAFIVEA